MEAAGLAEHADCVAGDFFDSLPADADAYLLSRVLHDWNDDDAVRILTTCRRAMRPDSRVVVVEAILPERAADRPAAIRMDLHMLCSSAPASERPPSSRKMLDRAGLDVTRVVMTASPAGLGVIEAKSAPTSV